MPDPDPLDPVVVTPAVPALPLIEVQGVQYWEHARTAIFEAQTPGNGLLVRARKLMVALEHNPHAYYVLTICQSQFQPEGDPPPAPEWGPVQVERAASTKSDWRCPACCKAMWRLHKAQFKALTGQDE